jgi:hypothetical protein
MIGSMTLYTTLIATSNFTPSWRCAALIAMNTFCFYGADWFYTGFCFFTGALLADLSVVLEDRTLPLPPVRKHGRRGITAKLGLPLILAAVAIYIGSYPEEYQDETAWSRYLHLLGDYIFPGRKILTLLYSNLAEVLVRLFPISGASLFIVAILFSPHLRHWLSHGYLVFLGSISFSMYLIHATLMRTVLAWVLFGILPQPFQEEVVRSNANGPGRFTDIVVHPLSFAWTVVRGAVFILWMCLLVSVATVWRDRVDRWGIKLARLVEEAATGQEDFGSFIHSKSWWSWRS